MRTKILGKVRVGGIRVRREGRTFDRKRYIYSVSKRGKAERRWAPTER